MSKIESQWVTKAGLHAVCLLLSSHRCGYVAVPVGHPLTGWHYGDPCPLLRPPPSEATVGKRGSLAVFSVSLSQDADAQTRPDWVFDVHGSLTYSGSNPTLQCAGNGNDWWFGFDCAHAGDGQMGRFATLSNDPIRTQEYVEAECESLAEQIVAAVTHLTDSKGETA